jgi:hypothetical protein
MCLHKEGLMPPGWLVYNYGETIRVKMTPLSLPHKMCGFAEKSWVFLSDVLVIKDQLHPPFPKHLHRTTKYYVEKL